MSANPGDKAPNVCVVYGGDCVVCDHKLLDLPRPSDWPMLRQNCPDQPVYGKQKSNFGGAMTLR